ncbi:hypothetical protein SAMN04490247_1048 [Salimicrobium halophilum]|uniref:Uncharacterized protein n=1 Tax=Salimicrobium halophilum TaxID=86666 RepID=A0A1G8RI13_9BACI|nr:hypothetical protein SAMN04490247_1048 [Salimicrobium halophilum]
MKTYGKNYHRRLPNERFETEALVCFGGIASHSSRRTWPEWIGNLKAPRSEPHLEREWEANGLAGHSEELCLLERDASASKNFINSSRAKASHSSRRTWPEWIGNLKAPRSEPHLEREWEANGLAGHSEESCLLERGANAFKNFINSSRAKASHSSRRTWPEWLGNLKAPRSEPHLERDWEANGLAGHSAEPCFPERGASASENFIPDYATVF